MASKANVLPLDDPALNLADYTTKISILVTPKPYIMEIMNLRKRHKTTFRKDARVYMPRKANPTKPIRPSRPNIFKRIKQGRMKKTGRRAPFVIPKFSIYFFLICLLLVVGYFAVMFINKLRNQDGNYEITYVVGLEHIPAYPESTFIFQNSLEQDSVKNFLSNGDSAYRLPNNTNIEEAFNYYTEKLPALGWQFVLMVSMEAPDKEYGQYWVKDNLGLRIYSKFNDIWYESITPAEAQSGLAERVKQETDMNLLLTDNDSQDLLPDFPWILKIPKEYLISYKASTYNSSLQQVSFSKIGAEEKLNLVPTDKVGNRALDYALNDYVTILNAETQERWGVINTYVISTNMGTGIRGTISTNSEDREVAVIQDSYNNTVYVLDSNVLHNPFFDYILENIKPQDTKKF